MVLADSSLWIDALRVTGIAELDAYDEVIATCPVVIQEVLQGIRFERAYQMAREALLALPIVESPMPLEVFEQGAQMWRFLRTKGYTIASPNDCLIASCAIRNDMLLLHRDRDFEIIAQYTPLQQAYWERESV